MDYDLSTSSLAIRNVIDRASHSVYRIHLLANATELDLLRVVCGGGGGGGGGDEESQHNLLPHTVAELTMTNVSH